MGNYRYGDIYSGNKETPMDFSQSDHIFISDEGVTYFVDEDSLDESGQQRASCAHNYETGTYSYHKKNSDGGCTVTTYNGKRCVKCGNVESETKISTFIYESCPH